MCCIKVERGWAPLVLSGINVECPHKYLTKKWARCEWVAWVHVHICERFLVLLSWVLNIHQRVSDGRPRKHLSALPTLPTPVCSPTSTPVSVHLTRNSISPYFTHMSPTLVKIRLMLLKYWRLKVYFRKPASQTIFYSWNKSFSRMPFISVYVASSFTLQI